MCVESPIGAGHAKCEVWHEDSDHKMQVAIWGINEVQACDELKDKLAKAGYEFKDDSPQIEDKDFPEIKDAKPKRLLDEILLELDDDVRQKIAKYAHPLQYKRDRSDTKLSNVLLGLFDFARTDEGFGYWNNIINDLEKRGK